MSRTDHNDSFKRWQGGKQLQRELDAIRSQRVQLEQELAGRLQLKEYELAADVLYVAKLQARIAASDDQHAAALLAQLTTTLLAEDAAHIAYWQYVKDNRLADESIRLDEDEERALDAAWAAAAEQRRSEWLAQHASHAPGTIPYEEELAILATMEAEGWLDKEVGK